MARYSIEESTLTGIADAIREKIDSVDNILVSEMAGKIKGIGSDSSGDSEQWIGDGNTHIWISLKEGRTSPMLGVCPKGTVTVDWGDGSEPDILTGTNTGLYSVKWTPNHEYAAPGDYIITLTVDGEIGVGGLGNTDEYAYILRYSSESDGRNKAYLNAVQKIELGDNVTNIHSSAFMYCCSLTNIRIPESITDIGNYAFEYCHSLISIKIPYGVTYIGRCLFRYCHNLISVNIPESVTSIYEYAFYQCYSLTSITIPESVTRIDNNAFQYCYNFTSITIPNSVTSIGDSVFGSCSSLKNITVPENVTNIGTRVFHNCPSLTNVIIPDGATTVGNMTCYECRSLTSVTIPEGVTSINTSAFDRCYALATITIPSNVMSIGSSAFNYCQSLRFCDFTKHTAVPTLAATSAFNYIPADCEIRVPTALVDEWKAATNWSTYADKIVGV